MMFIANCNLASLFRSSPCLIGYNVVEGRKERKGSIDSLLRFFLSECYKDQR